jgi:fructokinase
MKNVLAYGELLWDLLPQKSILGGAPANFAYRINEFGFKGIPISRLGKDELGEKAFKQLETLGIPTEGIQWDEKSSTGTVHVFFDKDQNPDYKINTDTAYDQIEWTPELEALGSKADFIYFGTLSQRSEKSRQTLHQLLNSNKNALAVLDLNLRKDCYTKESILDSLDKATTLKLNEDEAGLLSKYFDRDQSDYSDLASYLIEKYTLRDCFITLGSKGVFAKNNQGDTVYDAGYHIALKDSLGAGDGFLAGFLWHSGLSGRRCHRKYKHDGRKKISGSGSYPPF